MGVAGQLQVLHATDKAETAVCNCTAPPEVPVLVMEGRAIVDARYCVLSLLYIFKVRWCQLLDDWSKRQPNPHKNSK